MKPFIDIDTFTNYFNQEHIVTKTNDVTTVKIAGKDFIAYLIMASKQDYKENFTLEFILKFEYKKNKGSGAVLQKEFKIEHHPKEKSRHAEPHVQLHIHGPKDNDKVSQIWITLPLKDESEYIHCINGFFYILEAVIKKCEIGLEKDLLNVKEVEKLAESKDFLVSTIKTSLLNKGIEYQDSSGKKILLKPEKLEMLLKKDQSLLPFFDK